MATPRYFVREDTFWEVAIDGLALEQREGAVGTAGRVHTQQLAADYLVKREARRLVRERVEAGYVERLREVTREPLANAALEDAIRANPTDDAAYSVYGDWLQAHGDPRGELIALQVAGQDEAAAAYLTRHAAELLGPLIAHQTCHDASRDQPRPAFTWKRGFIHAARLAHNQYADAWPGKLATDVLLPLLQHPSGKFLVELVLNENDDPTEDTLDELVAMIARHPIPTLRSLRIGDDISQISWYLVGDLGPLWPAVPGLVELELEAGQFELGTIALPHLRRAVFRTGGLSQTAARSIAGARWPELRHLEVYFGDSQYGCTAELADARAIVASAGALPELRYLGLKNAEFQAELIGELAASEVIGRLHTLDMSCGILVDEHVDTILAHADRLRHLEVLDVSETFLTTAAIARLQGVAKSIRADHCWNDPDPEYRYVRVGE